MPSGRSEAHINEHELLTEILRTVLWGAAEQCLLLLGVTDNATSNMWFSKGRARRGVGLRLTRAFHRWVISQPFRYGPFYCRPERNIAADFTSRANGDELLVWEEAQAMTRVDPADDWGTFRKDSRIQTDVFSSPSIAPSTVFPVTTTASGADLVVEWQPSGFTLCRSALECGYHAAWISPRHSTMARIPPTTWYFRIPFGAYHLTWWID